MIIPPGNSLEADQHGQVFSHGSDLYEGLKALLERTRSEIEYNAAKGDGPYRLGMHDGLRYTEDALVDLLTRNDPNSEIGRPGSGE